MYNRNLRKPNPTQNVYKFASSKNGEMILCESSLEFDTCFHLEYSKDVVSYLTQPTGFYYEFEGKSPPYTPDFLVKFLNGSQCFWEVKPRIQAQEVSFQDKFSAKKCAAAELGYKLNLVTDRQIRLNPILNNLKLIHAHSGYYELTKIQSQIIKIVWNLGEAPLHYVADSLDLPIPNAKASVLQLLAIGELFADLSASEFGIDTVLSAS